jgi:hypothetical protein
MPSARNSDCLKLVSTAYCNEKSRFSIRRGMSEIDKINELSEPDELPPVHDDSAEYDAGFQAGKAGKPSDGKTVDWHRGWADAQD